jgi:hypothetical protein
MTVLLATLAVAAIAVLLGELLRRGGLPGSAILGGVLAGVLLGPGVLGRAAPETFERFVAGATPQREALATHLRHFEATEAALESSPDLSPAAQAEARADLAAPLAALQAAVDEAAWRHAAPLRGALLALALLLLLVGWSTPIGGGASPTRRWADALLLGAWAAIVPAGLAMLLLRGDAAPSALLVLAAALAVGPWRLGRQDRLDADAAEADGARLLQAAGLVASALAALALVGAAAVADGDGRERAAVLAAAVVVPLLAGAAIALRARHGGAVGGGAAGGGAARAALFEPTWVDRTHRLLVPALVSIALLRIEPWLDLRWWPLLVVVLLTDNGRLLGGVLAAFLPGGRRGLRAMRMALGLSAAGPTQAAIAAIAIAWESLPPAWGLALLLGAAVPELSTPLRARAAAMLDAAERELDEPPSRA